MNENFSVVISESTSDERDCCIHIREDGKERLMLHCQFAEQPEMDMAFIEDLLAMMAKSIAANKVENTIKKRGQSKARKVVDSAIKKMKQG